MWTGGVGGNFLDQAKKRDHICQWELKGTINSPLVGIEIDYSRHAVSSVVPKADKMSKKCPFQSSAK